MSVKISLFHTNLETLRMEVISGTFSGEKPHELSAIDESTSIYDGFAGCVVNRQRQFLFYSFASKLAFWSESKRKKES